MMIWFSDQIQFAAVNKRISAVETHILEAEPYIVIGWNLSLWGKSSNVYMTQSQLLDNGNW